MAIDTDSIIVESEHVDNLTIHELAHTTPAMSREIYTATKDSIESKGQNEAVIVFRNQIVDGRHRYRILKELNAISIKLKRLPHNTTIEELEDFIDEKETRKHSTSSQLAIKAWKKLTY